MFNEPKLLVFTFFPFEMIYVNISYICLVKNTFSITYFSIYLLIFFLLTLMLSLELILDPIAIGKRITYVQS